jgi:nicotinamide phosphoribosyltransferase
MFDLNPALAVDFYKTGHIDQQPEGLTEVYSNFTARSAKHAGANQILVDSYDKKIVVCGPQGAVQWLLRDFWNSNFFQKDSREVIAEYQEIHGSCHGTWCCNLYAAQEPYTPWVTYPSSSRLCLKAAV